MHEAPAAQLTLSCNETSKSSGALSSRALTLRAICLSLLLAAFFGYIIPLIDLKLNNTYLGSQHFAPGAVITLLVLVMLNSLLEKVHHRLKLTRDEQLTIYLSCLFSCLVAGIGGNMYWPTYIVGAFYYATPENKWLEFLQNLPWWMTPALDEAGRYRSQLVQDYFSGNGGDVPWVAWLVPMVAWTSVGIAAMLMTGCLSVILRAQWCENEALSFPLLRLPLEMTVHEDPPQSPLGKGGSSLFWRNPRMWGGFAIAALIQLLNGANLYFPDVPLVPLEIPVAALFSEAPWNQTGTMLFKVFPLALGLSYLLTAEISFSLWFFFWFFKFQLVAAYYLGYPPGTLPAGMSAGGKAFAGYQEVGAYIAIAALVFWTGREHFAHVLKRAFLKVPRTAQEDEEAMPYPVAFWGMLAAFSYLVGWAVLAGVHPLIALLFWSSYLVISIVLSRVLADSGLLFIGKAHPPLLIWSHAFGAGPGTALGDAPAASVMISYPGDMRSCLMPSWITSLKLASDRKIPQRSLWLLLAASMMLSFVVAACRQVQLSYQIGSLSLANIFVPRTAPTIIGGQIDTFARGEVTQAPLVFGWIVSGAMMVWSMAFLRSRFLWFPLHPTGYVMAISWAMHNLWLSAFLGWLCKSLITRFGGNESYRAAMPFFLGLALGDIFMMLFWLLIDGWQGRTGHILIP
ncbi:MAG TPA: DUF6785 family protein [Abditibacteriaceae bacterium]|jgi:hypothetical protein